MSQVSFITAGLALIVLLLGTMPHRIEIMCKLGGGALLWAALERIVPRREKLTASQRRRNSTTGLADISSRRPRHTDQLVAVATPDRSPQLLKRTLGQQPVYQCQSLLEDISTPTLDRRLHAADILRGRYLILEMFPETAYRIYRAIDVWTGQDVVIKQLAFGASHSKTVLTLHRCLEREVAILRAARQLDVPQFVESFGDATGCMLVTTFMPGKNLQDLLDAGSITLAQAWSIALSLCDAVLAIHQLPPALLHLDIKPLNIIITREWIVRLIDFGIARWGDEQDRSGEIMGTPLYTSPEQWGGGMVSERSDLFSVGAVLQALFAQFDETPSLRWVLKRATQQDPVERFATAAELREALMSAHSEVSLGFVL